MSSTYYRDIIGFAQRGAFVLATHMSGTPPDTDGITICEDGCTYEA